MRAALVVALGLALGTPGALAQREPEAELKAAFVYNFAAFTQWPPEILGTMENPLTLCVVARDLDPALARLAGKQAHGRSFAVRRVEPRGSLAGCRVAYWPGTSADRFERTAATRAGLLTIGDGAEFRRRGGMIQMTIDAARIVFDIDIDAAKAAGLRFSSRLLRLARAVHGDYDD